MGILNDMKKLLFGAKSAAKSATNKAVHAGKEAGEELRQRSENLVDMAGEVTEEIKERAEDFFDIAKDKMEGVVDKAVDVGGKVMHNAEALFDKSAEETEQDELVPEQKAKPSPKPEALNLASLDDGKDHTPAEKTVTEPTDNTPKDPSAIEQLGGRVLDTGAKVGNKVLDAGEKVMDKLGGLSEKVSEQVLDKGGDLWEKAKEAGSGIMDKANDLMEKAQEEAAKEKAEKAKSGETMDSILKKAKDMGDRIEERAKDKNRDFTDSLEDSKKSTLTGLGGFFDKASRFADGDYRNEGDVTISKLDSGKDKGGKTHGFEDMDGDGNDVIDDAIIDED